MVPKPGTTINAPAFRSAAQQATQRAAGVLKGGKAGPLQPAGTRAVYAQVSTDLENQDASDKTPAVRRAIGGVPGVTTYLSGFPALNHDTQPIYNKDLQRGETDRRADRAAGHGVHVRDARRHGRADRRSR